MPDQTPEVCACGHDRWSHGNDLLCAGCPPHERHPFRPAEPTPAEPPASETAEGGEECANCEDDEAPLHRWYAKNGDLMWLCEDCHGKCFAWLWDQVEEARQESPTSEPEEWRRLAGSRDEYEMWMRGESEYHTIPLSLERAISSAAVAEEGHWRRIWQQTNARADRLERALEEAREALRALFSDEGCDCDSAYLAKREGAGVWPAYEHASDCPVYVRFQPYEARLRALVSTESREEGGGR